MYNIIIFTDITTSLISNIYLGPHKIAHELRKVGYSCLVVNHLSEYTEDELKNLIELSVGDQTLLVGFSTTFLSEKPTIIEGQTTPPLKDLEPQTIFPQGKEFEDNIIQYIKSKNPNIKTMAGGHKINENYQNKNIDYVLIGYSEISAVNLADHLSKGVQLNHSYKNIHRRIIIDDRKATTYNFPKGDMEWLDIDVVNHRLLPIEIGRGCIFKCKFCSFPMNGKQQLDFVKDPEILYNELLSNYNKFKITSYMIVDDTFNDHIEKLIAIRDQVKRLPFQPIFWAFIRLDLVCTKPETLQILYDIGIRVMVFGIETLNQRTGRIIGKGYSREKQIAMIQRIKTEFPDITCQGNFIVGLPGESKESIFETFDLLRNCKIPLDNWIARPLLIFESDSRTFTSEFAFDYKKYGYKDIGNSDSNKIPGLINWENEFMTSTEAQNMCDNFNKECTERKLVKLADMAFHFQTAGYDFDIIKNIPFADFDWYNCEKIVRPAFMLEHKQKLLELIKQDINNR